MTPLRPRSLLLVGGLALAMLGGPSAAYAADRYAIILQAGTKGHEGTARAVHALLYAKELTEHGHEVVLIFDGAGTEWAAELSDPTSTSGLKPDYDALRAQGVTEVICDFCAAAFKVKDQLIAREAVLVGEYAGHPSIAKWANQGYQLIIL